MRLWNLDAAPKGERTGPRVLFSTPEARAVVVDLTPGQELGDHSVRERALIQVLHGSLDLTTGDGTTTLGEDTLVLLEPGEHHALRAREESRLLLTLAPWPAPDHYHPAEDEDPHELPVHATVREGL